MPVLNIRTTAECLQAKREPVDQATLASAAVIVADVRRRGAMALREHAERYGDIKPGEPLVHDRAALLAALDKCPRGERQLLEHAANRIRTFAQAQRACIRELQTTVAGGEAGHWIAPVASAGCYAPGGRFPLPSSVLMTAVTARIAGVRNLIVASPRPANIVLAAAAIADADALLAVGGAQAVAALAYGAAPFVTDVDLIVGPGNRWVTAAKHLVAGVVGIDMLAGPSEILIIADGDADPGLIAADLLAQAEHDADASVVLVTDNAPLISAVNQRLDEQLITLPTRETALAALRNSFAVCVADTEAAVAIADLVAPEHLVIMVGDANASTDVARKCANYGAVFIGAMSDQVLGDYAAGPNHVLPTGGGSRFGGGLSVFTFLRVRTFLRMNGPSAAASALRSEAAQLARLEGLEGHARAIEAR